MAKTVKQLNEQIEDIREREINPLLEKGHEAWDSSDLEKFTNINAELKKLNEARDQAAEVEESIKQLIADDETKGKEIASFVEQVNAGEERQKKEAAPQSIGEWFVKSDAFKNFDSVRMTGPTVELPVAEMLSKGFDFKTLMTTSDWPSQDVRLPGYIEYPRRRLTVADLLPQGSISAASLSYVEESAGTNAAATVAEGDAKPESALTFTEVTAAVKKIATWIPVTSELMEDEPALRSIIDARLRLFVQLAEEDQLISGNGMGTNLTGILNASGIQTQAKGSDPTPDAVMKAMTKIQVNAKFQASGIVMHPNDWQEVRLLKTADGVYIWGSPADEGPMRMWGLPVVPSEAISEGTALVGAFNVASQIFRRSGITMAVSNSHDDFFVKNKLAILAEERLALAHYRPAAYCQVTSV